MLNKIMGDGPEKPVNYLQNPIKSESLFGKTSLHKDIYNEYLDSSNQRCRISGSDISLSQS
jgi:hypothetical protein